jgi:hypothetical protein
MMNLKEFLKLRGAKLTSEDFDNIWDLVSEKDIIDFAEYHVEKAMEAQAKITKRCIIDKLPVPSTKQLLESYSKGNIL